MKLVTNCPVCQHEYKPSADEIFKISLGEKRKPGLACSIPPDHLVEFQVGEDQVYSLICGHAHKFVYIYPEDKFELLFRSGIDAYYDSNYNGAVTSVATSLERLYEFSVKVICETYGIDSSEFGNTWKLVKNLSERQYGAFLHLFLILTKKTAPRPSEGKITFRNDVVHKGHFPNQDKALNYIEDCLSITNKILFELKRNAEKEMRQVYRRHTQDLIDLYTKKSGVWLQTAYTSSFTSCILKDLEFPTVKSLLAHIEADRKVSNELSAAQ